MPDLIVVRLHPTKPMSATDFRAALDKLTVTAFDLTFAEPTKGVPIGSAKGLAVTPADVTKHDVNVTTTGIIQHYQDIAGGGLPPVITRLQEAIATAVIVVTPPAGHPEYPTTSSYDLRLELTRDGVPLGDGQLDFNINVTSVGTLPVLQPAYFAMPAGAYAAVPATSPGGDQVDLPKDGTPPNFAHLVAKIDKVLAKDPGTGGSLAQRPPLSPAQSRQVAAELTWDRLVYPPPDLPRPLGEMYTEPPVVAGLDVQKAENDRQRFEAELAGYHATVDARAARLATFVFAASAAVQGERLATDAARARLTFPILTGAETGHAAVTFVPRAGSTALDPTFAVPAAYLYALGAALPMTVDPEHRYDAARFGAEAQSLAHLRIAIENGVVAASEPLLTRPAEPAVGPQAAARRLRALGSVTTSEPTVALAPPVSTVVRSWTTHPGTTEAIDGGFWAPTAAASPGPYLELVLRAVTGNHAPLVVAVGQPPLSVTTVAGLVAVTDEQWRTLLRGDPALLPPFTEPGTVAERAQAFVRHLRTFFTVPVTPPTAEAPAAGTLPTLGGSASDVFARMIAAYGDHGGGAFVFGEPRNEDAFAAALADTFGTDVAAQRWLAQAVAVLDALHELTAFAAGDELRFSLMEALYAAGFTHTSQPAALPAADFAAALVGTVAHPFAGQIQQAAGGPADPAGPPDESFAPVNPDGTLTDCVPPDHLSPFGPPKYLHDLLRISAASTCEHPTTPANVASIGELLVDRRGPLGDLQVTAANLGTPLPVIDLVNESLENLAGGGAQGAIHNTAADRLAGHALGQPHDPATLFAAVPEHSSPATEALPQAHLDAYALLRKDFTAPALPYHQPLDVNRSYLRFLGTSRYAAMRRFRKEITELVLDPAHEPAGFQSHRWRYPVRLEIACEYLGISAEEYDLLHARDIALKKARGRLSLYEVYGFVKESLGDSSWTDIVLRVPEFLARTGLSYCEFLALWRSGFVAFQRAVPEGAAPDFPDCEPCCLDDLRIRFTDPADEQDPRAALRKLIVFVRLWRRLGEGAAPGITFAMLRDVCEVLRLFNGSAINADFCRQLAALLILHAELCLSLVRTYRADAASPAERVPLLGLWATEPPAAGAVQLVLDRIGALARARYSCGDREPRFAKALAENLTVLSRLAGFDPDTAGDTWYALPTHTLRFVEVLGKIYASDFTVGEIMWLFTVEEHRDGDDPFALQDRNESADDPLSLPEPAGSTGCDEAQTLWALRRSLLAVRGCEEDAEAWTWPRMTATLRDEFGYVPASTGPDAWQALGEHFFPTVLERCGCPVDVRGRQYRTPLAVADTSPLMWRRPEEGPFGYDSTAQELWTSLPVSDTEVIEELSHLRPLREAERVAVRNLYFAPRAALAPFAAIFDNAESAIDTLVSEPDEQARFAYFQAQFARFRARCKVIVDHLAAHVAAVTGCPADATAAATVLRTLWADENAAVTPWETDDGKTPEVTWTPAPSGGAFAALLGLVGTGLLGELHDGAGNLVWRETRGPASAFGAVRNHYNAPVPTVLPAMDLTPGPAQSRLVGVRNGFAVREGDAAPLGGASPFTVCWTGVLLVDEAGEYHFHAGAPTEGDTAPDFARARDHRWRVTLGRGQKTWIMLDHHWASDDAPAAASRGVRLRRGAYRITIEYAQSDPTFERAEEVCPEHTGFQLKYRGPDSDGVLTEIGFDRLFRDAKNGTLGDGLVGAEGRYASGEAAAQYLEQRYGATLRDIRRTYQRAVKAALLARRFALSATIVPGHRQSELGHLITHPESFAGTSYPRTGPSAFGVHHAWFDYDLLPVSDPYPPQPVGDQRTAPSPRRQAALFDWWERLFDYCLLRTETGPARERPVWLLFADVREQQPDDPAQLLRHLGVDLAHSPLLHTYFATPPYALDADDLTDERWALRVWQGEKWLTRLRSHFACRWIGDAVPWKWAADDPGAQPDAGNANLTRFVRDGCFENGEPLRYEDLRGLNDGLRERARTALLAYLCGMDRVPLPWAPGTFATAPQDLSDLLVQDVEAGSCRRMSRIEEAIRTVQACVQRARLGLEPTLTPGPEFVRLWERRLATYRVWEACRRREIYSENWIEWDELSTARESEAFAFLESELRRSTLTVPVPGGLEWWPGQRPPEHPSLTLLQAREPSGIQLRQPAPEGLGLLGTPERAARNSWLAPVLGLTPAHRPPDDDRPRRAGDRRDRQEGSADGHEGLPLWLAAAVRLGTRLVRVAAAGLPPAGTEFDAWHEESSCCAQCGEERHHVDEYYFWLADAAFYSAQVQHADVGAQPDRTHRDTSDWHRPEKLPALLDWDAQPMVHLCWSRVRHGEFDPPRRSSQGVAVTGETATLEFSGRTADSLRFEVVGAVTPVIGHADPTPPGFRYDLAEDNAVPLPLVETPAPAPSFPGGLAAYPYFVHVAPGAPLLPPSPFSVAMTVAGALRTHCQYESALKWYELAYQPQVRDNTWASCATDNQRRRRRQDLPCCPSSPVCEDRARNRAVLLAHLETMVQWAESHACRNTVEGAQQAGVLLAAVQRILGERPTVVRAQDHVGEPMTVSGLVTRPAPLNPRLIALYDDTADRIALIHHCLNRYRLPQRGAFGETGLREGWQETAEPCAGDCAEDCKCGGSPYRFTFLVAKANELCAEVRQLGAALLAAYEKGDAEALAALRNNHERQLLDLALEIRKNQWREADWQVQALDKTKEGALARLRYHQELIAGGLNAGETGYEALTGVSIASRIAGNVLEGVAQGIGISPDMWIGIAGIAGTPLEFNQLPVGNKLASGFSTAARIMMAIADNANTSAGLSSTEGGWARREREWHHQVEIIGIEIEQIERQILAAHRRRDIALRELNNHQQQIHHSTEVADFLRDKFTGTQLYLHLQRETAALYRGLYEVTLHTCRRAQRAFNYERGHTARAFLPEAGWDGLHEGLLAGERLQLALRQMEGAYLDANCREYELTKHLSLRKEFPLAFLHLQHAGWAEIELPEWLFDLDHPGHYLRRIKSMTVTIPCVVGPYTGVHARLTLLASSTRVDPALAEPPAGCCSGPDHDGYRTVGDDRRVVRTYGATEAIATSSGQNDSGLFELRFTDERYLPFEFAGAVSRWRIDMPQENNQFDFDTLGDIVLHLNYTAREGGDVLRRAASTAARQHLPGEGMQLFDVRHDFPDDWHRLTTATGPRRLPLRLGREHFPYLPGHQDLRVNRLGLFIETAGRDGVGHFAVRFRTEHEVPHGCDGNGRCGGHDITCVTSAEYPGLFHGELHLPLSPLRRARDRELGEFTLPTEIGPVTRMYLLCGYELVP